MQIMTKDRKLDIIFCIDGTGSMSYCINNVRSNASKFYRDLIDKMTVEFSSNIDEVKIKVITFRDYAVDGKNAMVTSEWFDLTAGDTDLYEQHLNGIVADGGGDLPESGMEALFHAMTADWQSIGNNDRQIIVLFTDADANPIGTGVPADVNMVDADGLLKTWNGTIPPFMSQSDFKLRERAKRLIIYAPASSAYVGLVSKLNRAQFIATEMSGGLKDIDFDAVIKVIAASASNA